MRGWRVAGYLLLWSYAAVAVAPLIVMVIDSLRPNTEVLSRPLALPTTVDFSSYATAWTQASFSTYVRNSVLVTVGAVALDVAVSLPASYVLGRFRFRGSGVLIAYFLAGLMLPIRLGILPIFYLLGSMNLVDSRLGLVLVYAASGIPFSVFIMSAFFRGLPRELEEAARIDGAGEFRVFARVMAPLVKPAIATVVVFRFVPLWNDFFFPLVLLRTTDRYTLPVGLTQFFGEFQTNWSALFAGLVIATVPLVVLFLVATKQIVEGLTAGMGR
ncbi:carbohydrate ABC transporter permease [Paractinoplanes globisporus]|jgi:raffinose/stachyose/melibiose transport system permease protein|uniref:Carbohydrate ABC transporter permease n=1 Tax=Paractinoplanes globisporus TaxID=113565 RepID=A0ABW6W6L0_9ACTN|nr:carbohydrate ABC transporter permease [Actinoplanes globisporus]